MSNRIPRQETWGIISVWFSLSTFLLGLFVEWISYLAQISVSSIYEVEGKLFIWMHGMKKEPFSKLLKSPRLAGFRRNIAKAANSSTCCVLTQAKNLSNALYQQRCRLPTTKCHVHGTTGNTCLSNFWVRRQVMKGLFVFVADRRTETNKKPTIFICITLHYHRPTINIRSNCN